MSSDILHRHITQRVSVREPLSPSASSAADGREFIEYSNHSISIKQERQDCSRLSPFMLSGKPDFFCQTPPPFRIYSQCPVASGELSIYEAFALSLRQENFRYAESLLPRIKLKVSLGQYFDNYIQPLAGRGSRVAGEELIGYMDSIRSLPNNRRVSMIGWLTSYFWAVDEEKRGP